MTAAGVGGDSPGRGPDAVEMRGVRSKVERRGSQAGFRAPAAGTNAGKASTDWATDRAQTPPVPTTIITQTLMLPAREGLRREQREG